MHVPVHVHVHVWPLFILQAPAQHLLSAAVMSAPAVIAITKLNYPETRESKTKKVEDVTLETGSVLAAKIIFKMFGMPLKQM